MNYIRTKFLYRSAVDELDSGHPFAAGMAVSLLQDAVEAMAHDAAASVNAPIGGNARFLEHWDVLERAGGKRLPYKLEMAALNAARVAFKHQGVSPSIAEVERQITAAHRFLIETGRDFFGIEFDELSEADLLSNTEIRGFLKAAEAAHSTADADKSLEYCRDARDLIDKLMQTAVVVTENAMSSVPRPARELALLAEGIIRRLTALEKSVALNVLGANPMDYWFLQQSLPGKTLAGTTYWPPRRTSVSPRTPERARACIRILLDLGLRVERANADLQRLAAQSGLLDEQKQLKELISKVQIPSETEQR